MGLKEVLTFVVTYLFGILVKKWPKLDFIPNDLIPQFTYVMSIIVSGLAPFVLPTPAEAAGMATLPGVPQDAFVGGTLNWAAVQVFDLFIRKAFLKGLFRLKLPF